jgi:S-DNA-T family DNA segregation ATPase FtsK/SpoIIIE
MSATRKELELQSDRIEMVLASHKAPARITGGIVTPRVVQFHLTPASGTRINKVQALADELALALGVASVRVSRQGGSMQLEVPRDDARPVQLLPLISRLAQRKSGLSQMPPGTAVLGLCDDGAPLLIRLPSPDVAHVLISGTTGSGKTALCQTMILSLAMTHRRSQLQFVLIDPKRRAFAAFIALPHLMKPIIGEAAETVNVLNDLVRVMETRGQGDKVTTLEKARGQLRQGDPEPRIVIVMDELADLMQVGGKALSDPLTRLAQRGREVGIHVVACTQKPSSEVMGTLIRANFPVRLVGKVVSPEDARVAAGIGGTGAEKLAGRGDFLAVAAGQVLRFQAAYVSAAEMEQIVVQMGALGTTRAPRLWDITGGRPSLLREATAVLPSSA